MKEAQTTTQPVLGSPPALKEGDEQEALVTRLAEEMTLAWSRGQHLVAETFLDRHPSLWHAPAAVLDLVYEEICLRQEYHEPVSRSELTRRFPAWRAQIEVLLTCAGPGRRHRISVGRGGLRGFLASGRAWSRCAGARVPGHRFIPGRSAGSPQDYRARRRGTPFPGAAAAHAHRSLAVCPGRARAKPAGPLHALFRRLDAGRGSCRAQGL